MITQSANYFSGKLVGAAMYLTLYRNNAQPKRWNDKATTDKIGIRARNMHMKTLSCREAGFDFDHAVRGETEEEVIKTTLSNELKLTVELEVD